MEKVLIVSDLHISDVYSGKHKDYFQNCVKCLEDITNTIVENNITHIYMLGDLVGMREKNLKSRDALFYLIKVLQKWNTLTDNNVYSIKGNHDIGSSITDFEFLVSLGYIKVVDFIDVGAVRFHGVNYGEETRALSIDKDRFNIALMHANLQVEGQTNWFRAGDGFELSSLDNLYGVDYVIAGHIHNPSERLVTTSIRDKDIHLLYPGNMTRPVKDPRIWDESYRVIIGVTETSFDMDVKKYVLVPHEELFTETYDDIKQDDEDDVYSNAIDIEELAAVLDELQGYNLCGDGDYKKQIATLAGIDKEAADLALDYIAKVEEEIK